MAVSFTTDQQKVIDTRNKNILVSAAAGSGKTAVLVERIIKRVTDKAHPIDIDKLLVVTFTSAAAAEMKERISNAIQQRLAEDPSNMHLQRQAVLVHQAQITTVHSFCLYLIKNHFEAIDLEPDFTVADEATIKLLAAECKEKLLEEAFAKGEEDFLFAVEFVCHNGKESVLEEYLDQLYTRAMSMPFPKRWLLERKQDYRFNNLDEFTGTECGRYLLFHLRSLLKSYREAYHRLYQASTMPDGPYMYADILEAEGAYLERMCGLESLEEISTYLPNMDFARLPSKKDDSVNPVIKEWVKEKRTSYKKAIQEFGVQFFDKSPQSIAVESESCRRVTDTLVELTIAYMEQLACEKRKRSIIDFNDMEHMALQILLRETEEGYEPTEIARSYQEFFEEVMIDEYQDSNMVQEYLVTALSGEKIGKYNRFMVGDVKQSIYKFRLARPELFMEKYHTYGPGKSAEIGQNQMSNTCDSCVMSGDGIYDGADSQIRIDLKQNFRSREEVLQATNSVFEKVMLSELGGIAYDENAALYKGAQYPEVPGMKAELIIAGGDKPEHYDSKEWEAYCTAARIKELIRSGLLLKRKGATETGDSLSPVTYGDIVLLFRSPSTFEDAYKKVFAQQGIPIYMTSGSGYFDALEVQNIVKFLQTIENPRLDIPLFGVCTSIFGGMTENQLAQVKIYYNDYLRRSQVTVPKGEVCLYDMLGLYAAAFAEEETGRAIQRLQKQLQKYRIQAEYMTVSELIYEIMKDYKYREYIGVMSDGAKRLSNVSLLLERAAAFGNGSYQGLFAFTAYINQLQKQSIDYGEAGSGEHTEAVRVMSIHKSKGLEFPVTFVCGMGQHYQMRDKQQMLLIDNDMGLGMDYINPLMRSKNRTLRKNVIALKMEQEIMAEEQRILYVAMTRAREKLIMVGYKEKTEKLKENAGSEECTSEGQEQEHISCMLTDVLEARSYLDLCLLAQHADSPIEVSIKTLEDYVTEEITESITREKRKELLALAEGKEDLAAVYEERLNYRYPHENIKDLYSKTSVSELKKAALAEEQEAVFESFEKANEVEMIPYIPAFMREQTEPVGAERGTAYHRVLELLDFTNVPGSMGAWYKLLDGMVETGKLSERQKECIYVPKMQEFIQSDIAKRMKKAALQDSLHKEESFFLGITANRINPAFPEQEMMLVQGIVDAYFEEDGELVLVDYKTDRVAQVQELVDRYRVQMQYYAEALEKALGKKVKETVLYSFGLGESVIVSANENFRKSL